MPISRRRFAAGTLAGLAACLPKRLQALRPPPKLLVVLIAEQFRGIYLNRAGPLLAPGGFNELMTNGAYFPNCALAASSFTSAALATLATGAYPQVHGIVADQWYDRRSQSLVKARAGLLEATTLADELARGGRTRVFCLGLDERRTSLLTGGSPAQAFWMDAGGQFNTRGNLPDWLKAYNTAQPIDQLHDRKWIAIGAGFGTPPLRTMSYDSKHPEEFFALYQSSPFAQDAQFDVLHTLLAAEKLGQGESVDCIFVTLGAMAQLGYETGSDSPLMDQMALQLDRQIQRTFEILNKTPGKGNYNLIFAAAHGAPPQPDPALRTQKAVPGERIARAISQKLSDWFDSSAVKNEYVDKYVYPFLYLQPEALRKRNVTPRAARKLAGEVALRLPGVAGYYTADGDCSHTGDWRRRFENSFRELRSGDVMLSYEPGAVEDYGAGRGVSYGSLYSYDTHVPLFLYGAQFAANVIERSIEAVDVAPTIARAAGVGFPSSTTGQVLGEAFAAGESSS
ncbi:MAG TPA: alkaline phosphatase family protein [Bryobacteraceae bacterium]|nr:alkaline phosphatase family protein [Bryobacteraceae bacterium]